MRIAYTNYIDDLEASALTAATASAAYPVTNVQEQRLTMKYRTTAVTGQSVVINLGSARAISFAAVISHNISSASTASIIVEANSSDSWPGATSQTLTWNAGMIAKFFTAQTYQYWKFSFEDPSNSDGYLSMGRLWLGDYIDISPSSLLDFTITKKRNDNVIYGEGRQKFATPGVGWREFALSFPESSYTMIKKIEDMYDAVGNHSSLIFCNFDTIRSYQIVEPCYCSIVGDVGFNHTRGMFFKYDLNLEEDL